MELNPIIHINIMKSHEITWNPTSCFFPVTTWRRPRRVAPRLQRCDQCLWEDRRMAAGWASREVLKVGIFSYGMMYDYIYIYTCLYIYTYICMFDEIYIYILYIYIDDYFIFTYTYMCIQWILHDWGIKPRFASFGTGKSSPPDWRLVWWKLT